MRYLPVASLAGCAVVVGAVLLARRGEPTATPAPALPTRIELRFTESGRATHRAQVKAGGRKEFELSVALDDEGPIPARAHLRGRGSLTDCTRKSYTVSLDGPARHLFPDTYADRFLLLSMCEDERYVQLHAASQLMAELGLYPLRYRYVQLAIDGEERGVYLMVEKADDALARRTAQVAAVVRRRFDAGVETYDVEKSRAGAEGLGRAWIELQASVARVAGADRGRALARRVDLPRFLDWLALMTLLGNGDYVDELWLIASDRRDPDGVVRPFWTFAGWDNDDLFSDCHYGGEFAFDDPHDIAYCADGVLDKLVLADPVLYERFVGAVERLIAKLTPDVVRAALQRTGDALVPHLERPEVCAAMVELVAVNPAARVPAEAQRDVRRHLDLLARSFEQRRALLARRIAAYRAITPARTRTDSSP